MAKKLNKSHKECNGCAYQKMKKSRCLGHPPGNKRCTLREVGIEEYLSKRTDDELIEEAKGLNDVIYNVDCFGSRDLILFDRICKELEDRGYELSGKRKIQAVKREAANV